MKSIDETASAARPALAGGARAHALPRSGGKAVFLTHSPFASPFRVGSHQLAIALGRLGWDVLHISTPVTPAHAPRALWDPIYRSRVGHIFQSFRQVATGVTEYIPLALLPWQSVRWSSRHATDWFASSQLGAAGRIAQHGFAQPDVLFLDEPRLAGMARWFKPRRQIYRATDLYSEMSGDPSVLVAEQIALDQVDGFVATSAPVFAHLTKMAPTKPGIIVENGVELAHFSTPVAEPADLRAIAHPRAVYVGSMDDRFDLAAVLELARQRPDVSFVLIGPRENRGSSPASLPHVHFFGARPYEQVPAYLQHSDVGLLPLTAHAANRGRSPMKIHEYGAAALPTLAAHTEEMARRKLGSVLLYRSPDEMSLGLATLLSRRAEFSALAVAAAQRRSWESRFSEIADFCDRLPSTPAAR